MDGYRLTDLSTRPGRAFVIFPSSSTATPFTSTSAAAHSPNPRDNNPTIDPDVYVMYQGDASGTSWASPLAAGRALRKMEEVGMQPYYANLYDWLIGWNANPPKAMVTATILSGYKICYISQTEWSYVPLHIACGPAETEYQMPSADNTSDARMLTWARGCP